MWARRGPLAWALRPLSALYRALAARQRQAYAAGRRPIERPAVPVVVVGNWIVGGAGKTPTLLTLLQRLQAWGWRAGVVSRGYGRRSQGVQVAGPGSTAAELGDEPLLIHRRSGVPLAVGQDRGEAARALLAAHPEIQILLSDDGLQHHRLARDLSILVFDARGLGNGWLLPAGPLRQDHMPPPLPGSRPAQLVLYSEGQASTALPGFVAQRRLAGALPLADWWGGPPQPLVPLTELRGRRLLAAAGLARPEAFFQMLRAAGLDIEPLPLPDHFGFEQLPWQGDAELLLTEKDAAKLPPERLAKGQRAWVLPLDLQPEPAFDAALLQHLQQLLGPAPNGSTPDRTAGLPPVQGAAATQP
ncbi:tetraacyldisaccharide 4'-kinase [Inhella sp.]|uniref:tetraacyldisaccharide 4'-kinase n=1 Tax=Inhella sp. TaxID=1921806 RepID=UPI0035B2223A